MDRLQNHWDWVSSYLAPPNSRIYVSVKSELGNDKVEFTLERCYRYPSAKIGFGKLKKLFRIYGVDWLSWSCSDTLHCVCKKSSNKIKFYSLPIRGLSSVDVESIESLTYGKLL